MILNKRAAETAFFQHCVGLHRNEMPPNRSYCRWGETSSPSSGLKLRAACRGPAIRKGEHMPYWWWILTGLAGLLAVVLLAGGISAIARRRPYWALGELLTGGTLLALAAVILLLGLDIQTFSRLTYERPVAR